MATPVFWPQYKLRQHNGNPIDLDTDTIRVMVLTSAFAFNAAHVFRSDIVANEVSGTNYTARGTQIAGVTLALDGNNAEWVHNDIDWLQSASGYTNGRVFAWYKDTGVDATSPIIMHMIEAADFGNQQGQLTLDGSAATGVANFV